MPYREYNEKISYYKDCIQKKSKLNILLKQTEQDLIHEKLELNKLLSELEKGSNEELKADTYDLTQLFCDILEDKERQQDSERQKLLRIKLKYDQRRQNVNYLVEQTKKYVDELSELAPCERDYDELIDKKVEDVSNDKDLCIKLKKLLKKRENIYSNIKEVEEAIISGEETLDSVEKAIDELQNTMCWGVWDLVKQCSVKSKSIDKAKNYAIDIQRQLYIFKREIADLNMMTGSEIAIGAFETFIDYFIDGLIYDWVVESKVVKTLDIVKNTKNYLDRAIAKLYEEKVTEELMLEQIKEQINQLVVL